MSALLGTRTTAVNWRLATIPLELIFALAIVGSTGMGFNATVSLISFPSTFISIVLTFCFCQLDTDECLSFNGNCSNLATCNNTFGSYDCICTEGYYGTGFECNGV